MRLPPRPMPRTPEEFRRQQAAIRQRQEEQRQAWKRASFLRKIAFVFGLAALGGCATAPRIVETPLSERIPAGLLSCRDRPAPGSLERQSDVAMFVVELDQAGADCRRKVGAINQIVQGDVNTGEE